MQCLIVIPTYNRSALIGRAVVSALAQTLETSHVMVIDDGSTDDTYKVLTPFFDNPRFCYVRLGANVGTARAKNVAIAYGVYDAVTFHDSDDIADPNKLLLQARCMARQDVYADPCLNWAQSGIKSATQLEIGLVLSQHWLIGADGSRRKISRALSLVDDFFPNLQMNAGPLGDWILINSGLFAKRVFEKVGGFQNCVEEDRELRNRILMQGEVIWLLEEPLLTKIECDDSLTVAQDTNYASPQRQVDRDLVWERAMSWRTGSPAPRLGIDLENVIVDHVSRPALFRSETKRASLTPRLDEGAAL